ncbi:hypothetical protein D3C72_1297180 [compost metagenome]
MPNRSWRRRSRPRSAKLHAAAARSWSAIRPAGRNWPEGRSPRSGPRNCPCHARTSPGPDPGSPAPPRPRAGLRRRRGWARRCPTVPDGSARNRRRPGAGRAAKRPENPALPPTLRSSRVRQGCTRQRTWRSSAWSRTRAAAKNARAASCPPCRRPAGLRARPAPRTGCPADGAPPTDRATGRPPAAPRAPAGADPIPGPARPARRRSACPATPWPAPAPCRYACPTARRWRAASRSPGRRCPDQRGPPA